MENNNNNVNNENNETFRCTYSAKQQREIEKIRRRYASPADDKMQQLRRLDRSVTRAGIPISVILGVIGALLLGVGMCCTMVWGSNPIIISVGIIIGLFGIFILCMIYPIYKAICASKRKKLAPEIIRLTDELMK